MHKPKTYNLADGGIITATSAKDFVTQLRQGSRMRTSTNNTTYMKGFADRYEELHGIRPETSDEEQFVASLIRMGYIS